MQLVAGQVRWARLLTRSAAQVRWASLLARCPAGSAGQVSWPGLLAKSAVSFCDFARDGHAKRIPQ